MARRLILSQKMAKLGIPGFRSIRPLHSKLTFHGTTSAISILHFPHWHRNSDGTTTDAHGRIYIRWILSEFGGDVELYRRGNGVN